MMVGTGRYRIDGTTIPAHAPAVGARPVRKVIEGDMPAMPLLY